jgi:hypothetical protein
MRNIEPARLRPLFVWTALGAVLVCGAARAQEV